MSKREVEKLVEAGLEPQRPAGDGITDDTAAMQSIVDASARRRLIVDALDAAIERDAAERALETAQRRPDSTTAINRAEQRVAETRRTCREALLALRNDAGLYLDPENYELRWRWEDED